MTIICSSYKLTLTKLINIITNSFLTFSLVEKSTLVRWHLVFDPKRQIIAFLLLPKISHNFDILKTGSKGTKSFMFTGGWVGQKLKASQIFTGSLVVHAANNCLAWLAMPARLKSHLKSVHWPQVLGARCSLAPGARPLVQDIGRVE